METKQLILKLIKGINFEGEIVYSDSYDLTDIQDIIELKKIIDKVEYVIGFILEKSFFEKGTYNQEYGENEFQPVMEVIYAENINNSFKLQNELFAKTYYHIIKNSIIDVKNHLEEIIIYSKYGINDVIERTNEMLNDTVKQKKYKKKYNF